MARPSIDRSAASFQLFRKTALVVPELSSCSSIDGKSVIPGSAEVNHTINKKWGCQQTVRSSRLEAPNWYKIPHVASVDFG